MTSSAEEDTIRFETCPVKPKEISSLHTRILLVSLICVTLAAHSFCVYADTHRRALLIGINDYSASRLGRVRIPPPPDRDWQDLSGAVNDAALIRGMLIVLYGFEPRDIVMLTDQNATRTAILQTLEQHLVQTASKGDVLLFYFAGHGSQVRNSLSDEPDKLDESLVPADSRLGIPDIRDKELRPMFNRILDRGARLSVLFDNCHSASGARGLVTAMHPRGVRPDLRDVKDRSDGGPRPESRGALVISATQDFEPAWEIRDEDGKFHGAFSWAWIRAMRDAVPGEPADETFLRTEARLHASTPYQAPVIAGNHDARLTPFLGARTDRSSDRILAPVENVRKDGTILLRAGWANGLAVGSELRIVGDAANLRVRVTALHGIGQSEARLPDGTALPQSIHSGTLMELAGWAAPAARPMRVWMPRFSGDTTQMAQRLSLAAAKRRLQWVTDPIEVTPAFLLRPRDALWELLSGDCTPQSNADAASLIAKIPAGSSLFVQFPATAAMIDEIGIDANAPSPEEADYILTGRYADHRLEYAWVRPFVRSTDRRTSALPLRTEWVEDSAIALRAAALRLRRIHAWNVIESPPAARSPYRLALRREGTIVNGSTVAGGARYELALTTRAPLPSRVPQRYVYAFVIDSYGKSFLLYPREGSVENRFPLSPPAPTIPLGNASAFEVARPYGVDTYFLLWTEEPLTNPWILEWDGVRTRAGDEASTPLEDLLLLADSSSRVAALRATPLTWSLEKVVFESIPPAGAPKISATDATK